MVCVNDTPRGRTVSTRHYDPTRVVSRTRVQLSAAPLEGNAMEYQTEDPALKRFFNFVQIDTDSDCLLWSATITRGGYGQFSYNRKNVSAHRFVYVMIKNNGEWLDKSIVVRHTCDNKKCVNVDHLISGSFSDNLIDAWERGLRIKKSELPYCKNGHERKGNNVSWSSDGYMRCRACSAESTRRKRERQKALSLG